MQAVVDDKDWTTHAVVGGEPMETYKAKDLFRKMAEAAHVCGDPGIQYDTTINDWHTSANTDRIHASNPCSEYMFLNDTACNLASLNLMKFVRDDGEFDVEAYRFAAKVTITAQEILVDNASYPTPRIEENSPQVPAARARLRQPRRAADEPRPRLRLGRGPELRRRPDRDHARRGVQAVEHHRPRPRRSVLGVQREPDARSCGSSTSTATPPTRSRPTRPSPSRHDRGRSRRLRRGARARRGVRLPECPGHRPRARPARSPS